MSWVSLMTTVSSLRLRRRLSILAVSCMNKIPWPARADRIYATSHVNIPSSLRLSILVQKYQVIPFQPAEPHFAETLLVKPLYYNSLFTYLYSKNVPPVPNSISKQKNFNSPRRKKKGDKFPQRHPPHPSSVFLEN